MLGGAAKTLVGSCKMNLAVAGKSTLSLLPNDRSDLIVFNSARTDQELEALNAFKYQLRR
jgi:hypothetical protein